MSCIISLSGLRPILRSLFKLAPDTIAKLAERVNTCASALNTPPYGKSDKVMSSLLTGIFDPILDLPYCGINHGGGMLDLGSDVDPRTLPVRELLSKEKLYERCNLLRIDPVYPNRCSFAFILKTPPNLVLEVWDETDDKHVGIFKVRTGRMDLFTEISIPKESAFVRNLMMFKIMRQQLLKQAA